MGTKTWSEIKKLSKATEADRAEARAELEAELGTEVLTQPRTVEWILDHADELAQRFEDFDPADGCEVPSDELLARLERQDTT